MNEPEDVTSDVDMQILYSPKEHTGRTVEPHGKYKT